MKGRKCHTLLLTREGKYDKLKMRAGKHLIPILIKPPVEAGSPGQDALLGAVTRTGEVRSSGGLYEISG